MEKIKRIKKLKSNQIVYQKKEAIKILKIEMKMMMKIKMKIIMRKRMAKKRKNIKIKVRM